MTTYQKTLINHPLIADMSLRCGKNSRGAYIVDYFDPVTYHLEKGRFYKKWAHNNHLYDFERCVKDNEIKEALLEIAGLIR